MTTWRAALLDRVEAGLRSRFGAAIETVRQTDDDGTIRLAVCWLEGGGSTVQLRPDSAYSSTLADEAVEVVTNNLWKHAPIAGSC